VLAVIAGIVGSISGDEDVTRVLFVFVVVRLL